MCWRDTDFARSRRTTSGRAPIVLAIPLGPAFGLTLALKEVLPAAALTLSVADTLCRWGLDYDAQRGDPKGHLVFAPAKYMSNRQLKDHGIDFAPLPFALYREG